MKRLAILLLSVLGMASMLHAQTGQVSGRLVDDAGQPVAFANVVLKALEGDSILAGTTSDENGTFSLSAMSGTYRLVASSAGYERVEVRCQQGDLGELTMSAKQLEAVTVTSSRTTESVDRFVVLPKKEEVEAAGRTLVLLDMLALPGLKVDVA
ncbi:MAG: carboxypeptidase regulatory-like domain-containing protein, partial [Bacteroidales bacterium]|nr:carboxypeptidase regulatory-like domain-containing protein [Bacteroidales bacterium]